MQLLHGGEQLGPEQECRPDFPNLLSDFLASVVVSRKLIFTEVPSLAPIDPSLCQGQTDTLSPYPPLRVAKRGHGLENSWARSERVDSLSPQWFDLAYLANFGVRFLRVYFIVKFVSDAQ